MNDDGERLALPFWLGWFRPTETASWEPLCSAPSQGQCFRVLARMTNRKVTARSQRFVTGGIHPEEFYERFFRRVDVWKKLDEQAHASALSGIQHEQMKGSRTVADINKQFPSKWIKADELESGPQTLTMKHVAQEDVGDDEKPVIYFLECTKGFVLNKTNANIISRIYSSETDNWSGKKITLYATDVEYGGKQVRGIRVKPPQGGLLPPAPPHGMQPGSPVPPRPPARPPHPTAQEKFWFEQEAEKDPILTDRLDLQNYISSHHLNPAEVMLCPEGKDKWEVAATFGFISQIPF